MEFFGWMVLAMAVFAAVILFKLFFRGETVGEVRGTAYNHNPAISVRLIVKRSLQGGTEPVAEVHARVILSARMTPLSPELALRLADMLEEAAAR